MLIPGNVRLFCGSSNSSLGHRICEYVGVEPGHASIESFPDGELHVRVDDDVRGRDCYVIQSTSPPVNENLMELLIFIDCLRRASARRITAVLPYFGYARQDRKSEGRTPISAKLVANLLTTAGVDRVLAMDLHAEQVQGFFDIPVDHLHAIPVIVDYLRKLKLPNKTLVSPDLGNVKTANVYAQYLDAEFAVIDKRRVSGTEVHATRIIGDVEGKDVLMVDDMITTAGTMCSAATLLREQGAKTIHIAATHGIFADPSVQRLEEAPIDEIVVTDTVPLNSKARELKKVKVLTVAELLGEAIVRIHQNRSVSDIFKRSKYVENKKVGLW
jgi:ribose-phosphate pyrophosphokinase